MTVPHGDVQQQAMGQVEGTPLGMAGCPYLSAVAVGRQALPSQAQYGSRARTQS